MMPSIRFDSTMREASSINPRSPLALVWARRIPESKVDLADLARLQFSALAASIFSCSAFFLAVSSSSIFFLAASKSLSLLTFLGSDVAPDLALSANLVPSACASTLGFSLTSAAGIAAVIFPGCCKTRFAGILAGGGWSLKTLRPEASSHMYCAMTVALKTRPKLAIKYGSNLGKAVRINFIR